MKKSDTSSLHEKTIFILISILAIGIGYYINNKWHTEDRKEEIEALEEFRANSIETNAKYVMVYDSTEIEVKGKKYKYYIVDYQFTVNDKTYSNLKSFSANDTIPDELQIYYHKDSPELNSFDIDDEIDHVNFEYDYGDKKQSPGKGYLIGMLVVVLCYANYKMIKRYFFDAKR